MTDGTLVVACDKGITRIIPDVRKPRFEVVAKGELFPTEQGIYFPKSIFEDNIGQLWIGEDQGISRIKNGIRTFYFLGNRQI